jgi:hypothetical protein
MILLYLFLFLLVFSHVQGLRPSVLFDMKKQPTSLGKCLALSLSLSLSLYLTHTQYEQSLTTFGPSELLCGCSFTFWFI